MPGLPAHACSMILGTVEGNRCPYLTRLGIPSARTSNTQLWEQPPRLKQMAYGRKQAIAAAAVAAAAAAFSPVALNAGGQALQLTAGGSDTRPTGALDLLASLADDK